MACIDKIYSVSALVGDGTCNAHCAFCAGEYLRPQAGDNPLYWKNYESALKLCARYGGWSSSITSSGEPTCDPGAVTKALMLHAKVAQEGAYFPNVNLFTNGIRLGDDRFVDTHLPVWKKLGLTNIAISFHSPYASRQATVYGVPHYPSYDIIRKNVERHGIGVRATLLLRRGEVDNASTYDKAVQDLIYLWGYRNITSWPVGNPDGSRNKFTPSRRGLLSIRYWLWKNTKKCHGHAWGGGVYDYFGNILRLTDYVTKHDPRKDFVRQLVVFQNGTVAYSWIRSGALCLK